MLLNSGFAASLSRWMREEEWPVCGRLRAPRGLEGWRYFSRIEGEDQRGNERNFNHALNGGGRP
jgi:hypothetical protein